MIKHVFFDLDHTLWDFEKNSEVCLKEIYTQHLSDSVSYSSFIDTFRVINKSLWRDLEYDRITHEELRQIRFKKTLQQLGVYCTTEQSLAINEIFIELLPVQKGLMPGTLQTLDYLKTKYLLHIISNGYLDIQTKKMRHSGIIQYFDQIITSDVAKSRKPQRQIFDYALTSAGASIQESIYIGDDEVADKLGAENADFRFIHFDIAAETTTSSQIANLTELIQIL